MGGRRLAKLSPWRSLYRNPKSLAVQTNLPFFIRCLTWTLPCLLGAGLNAAPLAWFPGPSLGSARSDAATVIASDGGNLLIAGDSPQVQELLATSQYWNYGVAFYGTQIGAGAVGGGEMILVYGGTNGTTSVNTVTGYSASDGTSALAPMKVARSYLGYARDRSGDAYAIGGLSSNRAALASAERYNGDANAWTAIASLPSPRYKFPAVFDGSTSIYVFGGLTSATSRTESATVLRYTVSTNKWSTVASMPKAVAGSVAAMGADGQIYVVGGLSGGVTTNVVQVYNPKANSWAVSTPLPEALSASSMGVDSLGRLIVMGGRDAKGNDSADVWRSQELGTPDSVPVFATYPATSATYLAPYVSAISATGNPQPTYQLVSGPAGMTVDSYSGAITWTPQANQIGANPATLRASNYAGHVDWSFTITVPNPPPTPPTNLAVVSVTDNSVTLSWDPESAAVGPATYRAYLRHSIHSPRGSGGSVWYTQIGGSTTVPTLTITGLAPGLSQAYYIVATASGGTTAYGPAIVATTTAPQGPASLTQTGLTSTTVTLSWSPSPGPAQNAAYSAVTSYTIMERKVSVSPPVDVPTVTNITGTSATITGLTPGGSHLWWVSGVDAAGNGSPLGYLYLSITNPSP